MRAGRTRRSLTRIHMNHNSDICALVFRRQGAVQRCGPKGRGRTRMRFGDQKFRERRRRHYERGPKDGLSPSPSLSAEHRCSDGQRRIRWPGPRRAVARFSRISDEDAVISVMGGIAARLETVDPGFVRTRRGARTACATILSWATLVAVTFVFGVAEPLPIALLAPEHASSEHCWSPIPTTATAFTRSAWRQWSRPWRSPSLLNSAGPRCGPQRHSWSCRCSCRTRCIPRVPAPALSP